MITMNFKYDTYSPTDLIAYTHLNHFPNNPISTPVPYGRGFLSCLAQRFTMGFVFPMYGLDVRDEGEGVRYAMFIDHLLDGIKAHPYIVFGAMRLAQNLIRRIQMSTNNPHTQQHQQQQQQQLVANMQSPNDLFFICLMISHKYITDFNYQFLPKNWCQFLVRALEQFNTTRIPNNRNQRDLNASERWVLMILEWEIPLKGNNSLYQFKHDVCMEYGSLLFCEPVYSTIVGRGFWTWDGLRERADRRVGVRLFEGGMDGFELVVPDYQWERASSMVRHNSNNNSYNSYNNYDSSDYDSDSDYVSDSDDSDSSSNFNPRTNRTTWWPKAYHNPTEYQTSRTLTFPNTQLLRAWRRDDSAGYWYEKKMTYMLQVGEPFGSIEDGVDGMCGMYGLVMRDLRAIWKRKDERRRVLRERDQQQQQQRLQQQQQQQLQEYFWDGGSLLAPAPLPPLPAAIAADVPMYFNPPQPQVYAPPPPALNPYHAHPLLAPPPPPPRHRHRHRHHRHRTHTTHKRSAPHQQQHQYQYQNILPRRSSINHGHHHRRSNALQQYMNHPRMRGGTRSGGGEWVRRPVHMGPYFYYPVGVV